MIDSPLPSTTVRKEERMEPSSSHSQQKVRFIGCEVLETTPLRTGEERAQSWYSKHQLAVFREQVRNDCLKMIKADDCYCHFSSAPSSSSWNPEEGLTRRILEEDDDDEEHLCTTGLESQTDAWRYAQRIMATHIVLKQDRKLRGLLLQISATTSCQKMSQRARDRSALLLSKIAQRVATPAQQRARDAATRNFCEVFPEETMERDDEIWKEYAEVLKRQEEQKRRQIQIASAMTFSAVPSDPPSSPRNGFTQQVPYLSKSTNRSIRIFVKGNSSSAWDLSSMVSSADSGKRKKRKCASTTSTAVNGMEDEVTVALRKKGRGA